MQGSGRSILSRALSKGCTGCTRPRRAGRTNVTRAYAQADRRLVRLTVAGPPDGQPPRIIEVDDPLSAPAELICTNDAVHLQKAGITKSEAREQAAIIQAQRDEIQTLRAALAETQEVMYKGKAAYTDVVQTKDMQIAQLYELAASGVRERAKLRQELSEMQQEMQGTKRQLHAFMASLMQLKCSMDSAGDGDIEHALELLQSSSWTQSMQGSTPPPLTADEDVYMQLVQMQRLSDTLVKDMKQDEELMQQGLEPRSRVSSYDSFDSMDSLDLPDGPIVFGFGAKTTAASTPANKSPMATSTPAPPTAKTAAAGSTGSGNSGSSSTTGKLPGTPDKASSTTVSGSSSSAKADASKPSDSSAGMQPPTPSVANQGSSGISGTSNTTNGNSNNGKGNGVGASGNGKNGSSGYYNWFRQS